MSTKQCCGIEDIFDQKNARKMLKKYRKKGAGKVTRMLIEALKERGIVDMSLLDIGGGVGSIQHELIKTGLKKAVHTDASSAYLETSKEEADRQGHLDKIEYKFGNFVELSPEIETADIVALDKVLCCYDDVSALLISSLSKTKRYYAVIYPRDVWWVKAAHVLEYIWVCLKNTQFRSFIHPVTLIEQRIESAGFKAVYKKKWIPWHIQIYEKINPDKH